MRCFVGVPLGEEARGEAAAVQADLRSATTIRTRWVDPASFHLTLAFLGEVDAGLVAAVQDALVAAAGSVEPFEAALTAPGAFPSPRRPRILWIGVGAGAEAFAALATAVQARLADLPVVLETRPFRPHLTIGRVRTPAPDPSLAARLAAPWRSGKAPWRVTDVTLFESELAPGGARHRPLAVLPLGTSR